MAYHNKATYENKREWAAARMEKNKNIECVLTEQQHDIIAWLCGIRHEIHTNMQSFFITGSCNFSCYWTLLDNEINNRLNQVGLDRIHFSDRDFIPNDDDWDAEYWDGEYDTCDAAYEACHDFVSEQHKLIEGYLRDIDGIHGTHYCPTGATRIY